MSSNRPLLERIQHMVPGSNGGDDRVRVRRARALHRCTVVAIVSGWLLLTAAASQALAQQPASAGQLTSPTGYEVNIAPYLWIPTAKMSLKYDLPPALGGKLPTDVSVGPGDIFSHLDIGAMFSADVRVGQFSLLTDLVYSRFSATTNNVNIKSIDFLGRPSIPISRDLQTSTGSSLRLTIWTLAGGYTVLQRDWGNLDVFAGFRFLNAHSATNYSLALDIAGPRGNGATFGGIGGVSVSPDVWNGIVGIRGRIRLGTTKLFIPYYFDIGAGGSRPTWQISSGLGYQFKWGAVSALYRYLAFEQPGTSAVTHVSLGGPIVMATFTF